MEPFVDDFQSIVNQQEVVHCTVLASPEFFHKAGDGCLVASGVFWCALAPRLNGSALAGSGQRFLVERGARREHRASAGRE